MTLKIEVEVPYDLVVNDQARRYLDRAMSAVGYVREASPARESGPNVEPRVAGSDLSACPAPQPEPDQSRTGAGSEPEAPQFRERNRPGEGRARRTKEEIAEDKALDAAAGEAGVSDGTVDEMLEQYGHATTIAKLKELAAEKAEPRNISASPEDRVNPEDEAQDKADEAAEVEAARDPENPLTVDDLRSVMGKYVEAHGMPATQEDGPVIFKSALGNPPAGEESWKLSLVAAQGQETLRKAVTAWQDAVASGKRFAS